MSQTHNLLKIYNIVNNNIGFITPPILLFTILFCYFEKNKIGFGLLFYFVSNIAVSIPFAASIGNNPIIIIIVYLISLLIFIYLYQYRKNKLIEFNKDNKDTPIYENKQNTYLLIISFILISFIIIFNLFFCIYFFKKYKTFDVPKLLNKYVYEYDYKYEYLE